MAPVKGTLTKAGEHMVDMVIESPGPEISVHFSCRAVGLLLFKALVCLGQTLTRKAQTAPSHRRSTVS